MCADLFYEVFCCQIRKVFGSIPSPCEIPLRVLGMQTAPHPTDTLFLFLIEAQQAARMAVPPPSRHVFHLLYPPAHPTLFPHSPAPHLPHYTLPQMPGLLTPPPHPYPASHTLFANLGLPFTSYIPHRSNLPLSFFHHSPHTPPTLTPHPQYYDPTSTHITEYYNYTSTSANNNVNIKKKYNKKKNLLWQIIDIYDW